MTLPTLNLTVILPELILVAAALVVLVVDLVIAARRGPGWSGPPWAGLGWLSFVAVLAALAATLFVVPVDPAFRSMVVADGLGRFLTAAVLIATLLACLISIDRVGDFTKRGGAYFALLLLAAAGMSVMTIANDYMVIFIGLEILSLALYILVGFSRRDPHSAEAALKYFLLGAFASGFFLYGVALIYAATGSTNLTEIAQGIMVSSLPLPGAPLLPIGVGLLIVGFGFKLAIVPFHMWTPDAYQGAPTPVTAFMSVATKAAVFAALIRVLAALPVHEQTWLLALAILAALTMTLGNLAALRQTSLKRMLAYSSIAQAGYVLTGLAAGNAQGQQGALYYLLAYTFMNIGAFAVLLVIQQRTESDVRLESLAGLSARQPLLAFLMAVFMFSLTGVPPLAGFFAKLYVFGAAVSAGLIWLVIIGVLNSAVAAYYYLRVTVAMYMSEPAQAVAPAPGPAPVAAPGKSRPVTAPAGAKAGPAMAVAAGPAFVAAGAPAPAQATARTRTQAVQVASQPAGRAAVQALSPSTAQPAQITARWPMWVALVIAASATVALGIWQFPWMQAISQAVATLAVR